MENNLTAAVDALFTGDPATYTTQAGAKIEFKRANLRSIDVVSNLLSELAQSDTAARFAKFVQELANEQAALLQAGASPNAIDFNKAVLVKKAFTDHALLLDVFATVAGSLPKFVASFATITQADYEELALDEQLIIAAGVVAVNYSFFTQSLRPIIASVLKGISAKSGSKQAVAAAKK